MFNKNKFALILQEIKETYKSQEDFSEKSGIGRTYISQYMNMKIDKPPLPKILEKIAEASKGITTYNELMTVCGYIEDFSTAIYDFSSEHDRYILNTAVDYINANNIDPNSIENDKEINDILDGLEHLGKNQAFDHIKRITLKYQALFNKSIKSIINYYNIPVYGQISAGLPNWAEECLEGYLPIDPNMMNIINPEECFFLRINGESMNKVIRNGAYALIRKQDVVENGEIAAILVNGDSATIKKFTQHGNVIVLEPMSDNPNFQTQIYDKNTTIKILGKYIGKFEINN